MYRREIELISLVPIGVAIYAPGLVSVTDPRPILHLPHLLDHRVVAVAGSVRYRLGAGDRAGSARHAGEFLFAGGVLLGAVDALLDAAVYFSLAGLGDQIVGDVHSPHDRLVRVRRARARVDGTFAGDRVNAAHVRVRQARLDDRFHDRVHGRLVELAGCRELRHRPAGDIDVGALRLRRRRVQSLAGLAHRAVEQFLLGADHVVQAGYGLVLGVMRGELRQGGLVDGG